MIKTDLYKQVRYITGADYVIGKNIFELDIEKANISVLLWKGVIDKSLYNRLYSADKTSRQIYIGNMIKHDTKVYDVLKAGIEDIRKIIFDIYSIEPYEVISIRNDAIFFVSNGIMDCSKYKNIYIDNTRKIHIIQNNGSCEICVRCDGIYSSFYKLNSQELFYYNGRFDNCPYMNITSMGDSAIELHKEYFGNTLMELFSLAERDIVSAINSLNSLYMEYINRKLDTGFYREFSPESKFCLQERSLGGRVYLDTGFKGNIRDLDISYNESILRQLQKVFSSQFFNRR